MDSKQLEDLLDRLREGIRILGCRSLARPGDRGLLDGLREGSLPAQDFFRELLRAVFGQLVSLLAQRRGMARSDRKEIALEGVSPLDLERLTPGDLGSLYERLLELHPTVDAPTEPAKRK